MVQRVVTANTIESDWESVQESVVSSDDAVIVEANGKPNVVVITYDRYQRALDLERQEQFEIARRELDALAAIMGDRNSDLTPEEIEELGNRFVNEPLDANLVDDAHGRDDVTSR